MPRISQTLVPTLIPPDGEIRAFLLGEAPGPRGADQSGLPFWGDRAGIHVYRALEAEGLADIPAEAYETWDGARFRDLALCPILRGVALGNAYDRCPTSDGQRFRAPSDKELLSVENLQRIRHDVTRITQRCPGTLRVIALGKRAHWLLERLDAEQAFELHALPHPSAQGLLQAAPGKGKGARLADLQAQWEARLRMIITPPIGLL